MPHNLFFITLVFSAFIGVSLAGPGGHGGPRGGPHGDHHLPPYLKNVTAEGRKEFDAVVRNESLTIAQMETQLAALAEKYGVATIYNEFQAIRTALLAEIKANQTVIISNLTTVSASLASIYQNKDQTRKQQEEAVEAVRKTNPIESDTIKFIREKLGGGRGHGGRGGPHGGPRGGPGGPGGPRGGGNGGRGGHPRGFY